MTAESVPSITRTRFTLAKSYGTGVVLIVVIIIAAATADGFTTYQNLLNILRAVSFTGIVAVGMTFVILGGFYADLSVPATVTVAALLSLGLAGSIGALAASLVGLGAATAVGVVNGVLVAGFRGNPIIVTLATQTLLVGIIVAITEGSFIYGASDSLARFGKASVGPVPVQVIVLLAAVVVGEFLLRRTAFGHRFYAVGANPRAARLAGVGTRMIASSAFIASGLTAGIAGILLGAFSNQANVSAGNGIEFAAIAAVVVGGTSLFGGFGGVLRTFVGALLIGVIDNTLVLKGLAFESRLLVTGATIIIAVWFDSWVRGRST